VRNSLLDLGIPARRLVTIYKGHDPAWYDDMPEADLRPFGVPDSAFVVTCVAKMRARKGVEDLVQAARLIPDDSVHVLLVGDAGGTNLASLVRSLGLESRVHLTGFLRNAAAVTGRSHVFVMPSLRREGLPRAVIEAMAQRVPAVVTSVGGMPELVRDGECGLIVPPHNPAALAEAILKVRRDEGLRLAMAQRARERIQNHFHIHASVAQFRELYREVVQE
jgi:glycosyltransferase involved in cell wall biosynthesis